MSGKHKKIHAKLIANPGSGKQANRGQVIEQTARSLKDLGVKVDAVVAKPKEKATTLARKAIKDGYKVIIAMGGDDTVEAVIRGMAGSKARLGIIPAGTANDLAKSLGISEDTEEACRLIAAGDFRKLDMGQVRVGKKGKKLHFFELVTMGIVAAVYPDALHVRKGRLSSLKGMVQTILSHESRPKMTLVMDGESDVTLESMLAIVSNVPMIGPNMVLDPDASMDDGYLDVILYPGFSKAELLAYFARAGGDTPPEDGKIQRYRAKKVHFKSSPKQEVMADGVMLGKGKVRIKTLPGALRVFAPPPGSGVEKPAEETAAEDLPAPLAPAVTKDKVEASSGSDGTVAIPEEALAASKQA